jgi:putative NADH-flavin reductase
MNVLILGATGRTGREVTRIALARGHRVTVYVRSPDKLGPERASLHVERGDALDTERLSAALVGQDAVISVLGLPAKLALRPSTFMAEAGAATVAAMKRAGVTRLALVSAAVLFLEQGLLFAFFRWFLRHHARDLTALETVVQATELEWTIARPPRLVDGKQEKPVRVVSGALPEHGFTLSFSALGAFLVDCVEQKRYLREIVGLSW